MYPALVILFNFIGVALLYTFSSLSFTEFYLYIYLKNIMEIPKKLYHYTSINTLALILKSQAINLGRLDVVNDKREGSSSDFGSFAQYIFISCWTETSEENLALWNMYTHKMRGVRIELPLPIFSIHKINEKNNSIVPQEETVNNEKAIFVVPHTDMLYKMTYTDDDSALNPEIIVNTGEFSGYSLNKIAVCKKSMWSIENEWRFRLNIFPFDKTGPTNKSVMNFADYVEAKIPPSISSYLVKIDNPSFSQMKIRLGPRLEKGDYEIVEALVNTFNPNAIIEISSLVNEIR